MTSSDSVGHKHNQLVSTTAETGSVTDVKSKSSKGQTTDSISTGDTTSTTKAAPADNPDLTQAMFILWFSGNNNNITINDYAGKSSITALDSAKAAVVSNDVFRMEMQSKMDSIIMNVLNAWSKSVAETGAQLKRDMESESHRVDQERKGNLGHEAYLSTLSSQERFNMIDHNRLTKVADINEGFSKGIKHITESSGDLASASLLAFVGRAAIESGGARVDIPPMPGTISVGTITGAPIIDGSQAVTQKASAAYSVDMSVIATLYINDARHHATAATIAQAPGATPKQIDYEFSKNYAKQMLKLVNGSDFNSFAMAILTHTIPQNEQTPEKIKQLTALLKISLVGPALALVYKNESSVNGVGGGISGKEMNDLLDNKRFKLEDKPLNNQLIKSLNLAFADLTPEQAKAARSGLIAWADTGSSNLDMMKVSPLFTQLRSDTGLSLVAAAA